MTVSVTVMLIATGFVSGSAPEGQMEEPLVDIAHQESTNEDRFWSTFNIEDLVTLERRFTPVEIGNDILQPLQAEEGIGPGTELRISSTGGYGSGCTANFIWTDPNGRRYLGTAGHCILPSDVNGTHGPNRDFDASSVQVRAAVEGCKLMASTFVVGVEGCVEKTRDWVLLGEVVYARRVIGEWDDFALVRIPEDVEPLLRFKLPRWGGPSGESHYELGDILLHYGQGMGWKATPETRARVAVNAGWVGAGAGWWAAGAANQGDSGSPFVIAREDADQYGLEGGPALGWVVSGIPPASVMVGVLVSKAKEDLYCYVGMQIWVLPGGTPLQEIPPGCPPECPEKCGPDLAKDPEKP